MRVVALPRDVVDVHVPTVVDAESIVYEAGDDPVLEDLAGEHVPEILPGPLVVVLVHVVDALEGVGDPADATLREGEVEVGVLAQDGGPHQVGRGLDHIDRLQADHHVDRRLDRSDQHLGRRAKVHADDRALVGAGLPEWIPVVAVQRRPPELLGVLGERDGVTALLGHAAYLGCRQFGFPDDRDGQRDEPPWLGVAPFVDVPVVVGPHHRQGLVLVFPAREELAAELGERGEAHGAEHAVDRHVAHPLVDVETADPHVVERRRLEPVLLGRAADHGIEAHVGDLAAVVVPEVRTVGSPNQLWRLVLVLGRQQAVEHAARFDHMVVHADQDQIFGAHAHPLIEPRLS